MAFLTLPGARLVYDGQIDGRKVHLSVLLGRQPDETPDPDLREFYERLLHAVAESRMHEGTWQLCETSGWPDNQSHENLIAWCWEDAERRSLIVVNLSAGPAQGRIWLPWEDLDNKHWTLADRVHNSGFDRDGEELAASGLFVALDAWGSHVLQVQGSEIRAPQLV